MPVDKITDDDRRSTDLAEGELDTVEESLKAREGMAAAAAKKPPLQGSKSTDLAEGEEETVDDSIRIHEQKRC